MGLRKIPEQKDFQSLMWKEMSSDPNWSDTMDDLSHSMIDGESWPEEVSNEDI